MEPRRGMLSARKLVQRAKRASSRMAGETGLKNIHRSPKGSPLRKEAAKRVSTIKSLVKSSLGHYSLIAKKNRKGPLKRSSSSYER